VRWGRENARVGDHAGRRHSGARVFTCGADDTSGGDRSYKQRWVRRLPVEGFGGTIMGMEVSM